MRLHSFGLLYRIIASLAKVIEFCRHYAEEPMSEIEKPLKSANMHEVVQEWYANYVDVDQELLFELILAANES